MSTALMLILWLQLAYFPAMAQADDKARYSDFIAALENLEHKEFRDIVIQEATEYLRRFPRANDLDQMHAKIAAIYDDRGDATEAFFTHMEIVYLYPRSPIVKASRDRVRTLVVNERRFKPLMENIDRLLNPTTLDSTREAAYFTFLRDMVDLRLPDLHKMLLTSTKQFLNNFPDSPRSDAVLFWRGELLAEDRETREALAEFLKLTYVYNKSVYVTSSKLKMAELFNEGLRNTQKAILTYEEFLLEYPEDPQAPQAQLQIARIQEEKNRRYLEAINAYVAVARRYPSSVEAVPALFEAARLYEDKFKEYDQAIRVYTEVVRDFPNDLKAPYALAEAARIYEKRLKDYANAANVYYKVYVVYPQNAIAAASLYAAAELTEKRLENYEKALEYYRAVVDKYSGSNLAQEAGKRIERIKREMAKK